MGVKMIMRTRHLWIPLSAILCLVALASCNKFSASGSIKFRAKTHGEMPPTKTAYSGQTYDGADGKYERIDWVDGDKIALAMSTPSSAWSKLNYIVSNVSAGSQYSNAKLEHEGENGLQWGEGVHDFWAAYPSSATVADHTLSAAIPGSQTAYYDKKKNDVLLFNPDMSLAFMVASNQADPENTSSIDLDFYPAFNTFDFTVKSNDNIYITGFDIETETYYTEEGIDVPLWGTVVADFSSVDNMSYTLSTSASAEKGRTIGLVFDDSNGASFNPQISTTTSMNFKVFALPQDITGVRISFHLNNGVTHSLRLKQGDDWVTFPAGIKAKITGLLVPGAEWYINFDYPREEQWIIHPDIEIGVE